MNSSRLLRALITGLTLLSCLWVLGQISSHKPLRPQVKPVTVIRAATAPAFVVPALPDSLPPVEIHKLPLAALDNTCFDGVPTDLSCHTGMLSGGPAREYLIRLTKRGALRISVEPRDDYYDLSFALFESDTKCVLALDEKAAGQTESAVIPDLSAGVYRLVVGGYSEDCGPYLLTVCDQAPPVAQLSQTNTHRGRNGTVIRWRSFAEVDIAHFLLYRVTGANRERIAVLRAHGSTAGFADYRFTDRRLEGNSAYEIEAVSRDGRSELVSIAS